MGGSSAGSYLADPASPIPSHCASVVVTSTWRINFLLGCDVAILFYSVGAHILQVTLFVAALGLQNIALVWRDYILLVTLHYIVTWILHTEKEVSVYDHYINL